MDISSDQYKTTRNQSSSFPFKLNRTVQRIYERLEGFFTLTEEDRLRAGIQYSGKRDDG
jgi:hypothetical protein